eukprot:5714012-Prymnesium_polylepis.2
MSVCRNSNSYSTATCLVFACGDHCGSRDRLPTRWRLVRVSLARCSMPLHLVYSLVERCLVTSVVQSRRRYRRVQSKAQEKAKEAKARAKEIAEEAIEQGREALEEASQQVKDVVDQSKDMIGDILEDGVLDGKKPSFKKKSSSRKSERNLKLDRLSESEAFVEDWHWCGATTAAHQRSTTRSTAAQAHASCLRTFCELLPRRFTVSMLNTEDTLSTGQFTSNLVESEVDIEHGCVGQHEIRWEEAINLCVDGQWYELQPCTMNLQQFPSVKYASGGDPVVLEGAELEVAERLLLGTLHVQVYDLWATCDHVGAMPIHSLALANNKVRAHTASFPAWDPRAARSPPFSGQVPPPPTCPTPSGTGGYLSVCRIDGVETSPWAPPTPPPFPPRVRTGVARPDGSARHGAARPDDAHARRDAARLHGREYAARAHRQPAGGDGDEAARYR